MSSKLLVVLCATIGMFGLPAAGMVWAEGTEPLVDYGDSATNAVPQDLDADANEVVVLKYLATPGEFRVERRNRDGDFTSPEIVFASGVPLDGGRIALGPGGDAFVLGTDPVQGMTIELRRVAPNTLPTTIAFYDMLSGFPAIPIDLAATGTGEVLVLKRPQGAGSEVLVIERRDRDGTLLGPELALVLSSFAPTSSRRIAGGPNGEIYVLASVRNELTSTDMPAVFEIDRDGPPVLVASFDPFPAVPGSEPEINPQDLAVDEMGNIILLGDANAQQALERINPQGQRVGIRFPVPGSGGPSLGRGVGAGASADYFLLSDTFVDVEQNMQRFNPALYRHTMERATARLAAFDMNSFVTIGDAATDPSGDVWLQKSVSMSAVLLQRLNPAGAQIGPQLFLPGSLDFMTGGGFAADANGFLYALLNDPSVMGIDLYRVSPQVPGSAIASFNLADGAPRDIAVASNGDLALLISDPIQPQVLLQRRTAAGAFLSEIPVSALSGFGPRLGAGAQGNIYALVGDPITSSELLHIDADDLVSPVLSFSGAEIQNPRDVGVDEFGNALLLVEEAMLRQFRVERVDSSGALLEVVAAIPSSGFASMAPSRITPGLLGDVYVTAPGDAAMGAGFLYRNSELIDSDSDGILDDGNISGITLDAACIGGNAIGCDDNCTFVVNADQSDIGSVGSPGDPGGVLPDAIGDACQCGDVNGDSSVTPLDTTEVRLNLVEPAPFVGLLQPSFCNVLGAVDASDGPDADALPDDCNIVDVAVLMRSTFLLSPGIAQSCAPAVGL